MPTADDWPFEARKGKERCDLLHDPRLEAACALVSTGADQVGRREDRHQQVGLPPTAASGISKLKPVSRPPPR
ncbi:hypothetical protein [Streptomyces melanogenes]|uniref:Uncharacterized protein n=1 Tax=Streptomyces melanogenes TaxID=67326 RepID=A0ABZ1XXC4_9ACTN|nr:hypothetical protein [Streptomyces melanogenes]